MNNCRNSQNPNSIFTLVVSLFLVFLANQVSAQQNYTVILSMPAAGKMNMNDFWGVTVINNSGSEQSAYLVGTATESKDGQIAKGTTVPFTLKKGTNKIKIKDLPKTPNVEYTATDPRYKESLIRAGEFPSGIYEVCVKVISAGTNEELGSDCINQEVNETGLLSLITPDNEQEVDPKTPLIFTWTLGGKTPVGGYTLKIVEITENQTPESAMKSNRAFFEKKGIEKTTFTYPNSAKGFEEGKKYAWGVGLNGVWSEIWLFRPGPLKPRPVTKFSCKEFKVNIVKNDTCKGCKDTCCYNISINNNFNGKLTPQSIRIITNNSTIVSAAGIPTGWNQTPINVTQNTNNIVWNKVKSSLPTGITNLGTICFGKLAADPFYVTYELMNSKKQVVCRDSVKVSTCSDSSCQNNLIRNGEFIQGNQAGQMPSPGTVQYWSRGYGSPTVDNNPSDGFIEQGYIKLSGNVNNGQAIVQGLDPSNKIVAGKKYLLSVAVRFTSSQNTLDYVKIRGIAFNGNIFSTNGSHPPPSIDVAIISRSGKVRDCNDWAVIEFPVWTANKDFSNIAINAFTNDNSRATVFIDDVKLCEAAGSNCEEVQLDDSGSPIIPNGYGVVPQGFTCQPEEEEDEYYNGSLQDLYPGYNGTTDLYSQGIIPCPSIGGTLPPEVNNYNCDDSLKALGINMTCDELKDMLLQNYEPAQIKTPYFSPILPIGNNICDTANLTSPKFNINDMAFHGRDIIYVHGLMLSHLCDRAGFDPGANVNWPDNKPANQSEFYTGYYKGVARDIWKPHIQYFKTDKGNKNRYLIVTYNCSQNAEVAAHSILSQIREAMENGTGVEFDPLDPRKTNCFGRDYVMISYSAGALVSDIALSTANKTKTNSNLKLQYGDIGLISDRCKGHIGIHGTFSGSNVATMMVYAQADPILSSIVSTALSSSGRACSSHTTPLISQSMVLNSILIDLIPPIARARWSSYLDDVPVPVFTVASGHPSAILHILKYSLLPGFDDGVASMDCANGNNDVLLPIPSSFLGNPIKVFDMGIPKIRAIDYFLDQKVVPGLPGQFGTGSTPYLSPTGMVQPVISILQDPQIHHFKNHYSFIQSSGEHYIQDNMNYFNCDYWKTFVGGSTNNEEELVVSNLNLFTSGLIDPSIISQMGEIPKEKFILYPWIKMVFRHGFPRLTVYWKKFYIWKRTYHKLIDNCMYDVDYAYKYLFKH